MSLLGDLHLQGFKYYFYLRNTKQECIYYIISSVHKQDIVQYELTGKHDYPVLESVSAVERGFTPDYVVSAVRHNLRSGKFSAFGNVSLAESVFETLQFAKTYTFSNNNILENISDIRYGIKYDSFRGLDNKLTFEYEMQNGIYHYLLVRTPNMYFQLRDTNLKISATKFDFTEVDKSSKKALSINTLDSISFEKLEELLDLSWYKNDDGTFKKDYKTIENVLDFELKIMTPLVKEIKKCENAGTSLDVSVDTETTGLGIFNLSKDNEDRDHCVAIPITWEEDKAFVIFTDMKYFSNVPNKYAMGRLTELFENFKGFREIEYYELPENDTSELSTMNLFDDNHSENQMDSLKRCIKKKTFIKRTSINLVGHNVMFDGKVFYAEGFSLYFDDDTLQMAFNLNPKQVKLSNKLKALTRRIFGHETPELSDVLGKGNEDKYKYISDKRVAELYGCADGDYTLKLLHYLRKVMSKSMYNIYRRQDVPMLNILYKSEYYGMRTTEDEVLKLAEISKKNIEILKNFMYSYVGKQVAYNNERNLIDKKYESGFYQSEEEYRNAIKSIKIPDNSVYEFEVKDSTKRHVMYDILKYKIYAWTDGKNPLPKVDKYVMKKLSGVKRTDASVGFGHMKYDLITADITMTKYLELKETNPKLASEYCLISASEFNTCQNPLAIALLKYSELDKEYTSYYKPIVEKNLEGKMFYGYSMARIETRRIANPGQTMKGKLKALIRAYTDDYYLLDFDMSQAEYRIMVSLAKYIRMIHKMNDPESDYHIETASLVNDIPAHMVTKKVRKQTKSISFGVPYGLSERSLCENIFGTVNDDTMFATRLLLQKWYSSNQPISDMLNKYRADALVEREISKDLRDFMDAWKRDDDGNYLLDSNGDRIPIPLGFVKNEFGFYRSFNLDNLDKTKKSSIERAAGNYPIQSFASEVFRIILIRFYQRCEDEGINDKIIWHMLIHDELLCSVHKSLNPFYMYKLVKESCMISLPGHTKYYIGINVGNTWAETKDDSREAPIYFVDRIIKRWDAGEWDNGPFWFDDPWEFVKPYRKQYISDRIYEVVKEIQTDVDTCPVNVPLLLECFTNYTVRAYVKDYPLNHKIDLTDTQKEDPTIKDNADWSCRLESWILERFGPEKEMIDFDHNLIQVKKNDYVEIKRDKNKAKAMSDVFNDDAHSILFYDDSELEYVYSFDESSYNNSDEDEKELIVENKKAISLADHIITRTPLSNISKVGNQIFIKCKSLEVCNIVKAYLKKKNFVSNSGDTILFKYCGKIENWLKIKGNSELTELDKLLNKLNNISSSELRKMIKQEV